MFDFLVYCAFNVNFCYFIILKRVALYSVVKPDKISYFLQSIVLPHDNIPNYLRWKQSQWAIITFSYQCINAGILYTCVYAKPTSQLNELFKTQQLGKCSEAENKQRIRFP